MSNYSIYFALEKKLREKGFRDTRFELIHCYTSGAKNGLSQLTDKEYKAFVQWIKARFGLQDKKNDDWKNSPENQMRRKIFILFVAKMNYNKGQVHAWVEKYGMFHKPLQKHTYKELTQLLTQAENVYKTYTKSLRNAHQ